MPQKCNDTAKVAPTATKPAEKKVQLPAKSTEMSKEEAKAKNLEMLMKMSAEMKKDAN